MSAIVHEIEADRRAFLETAPSAVLCVRTSDRRVLFHNRRAGDLFSASGTSLIGRDAASLIADDDERHAVLAALAGTGRLPEREVLGARAGGQPAPILLGIVPYPFDDGGATALWWISDLAAVVAKHDRAEGASSRDDLTGLPTAPIFEDNLGRALARATRHGTRLAVLFCDLDDFSTVNGEFGRDYGDRVLREAAHRIRGSVRETDTVARWKDDVFAVLIEDLKLDSGGEVVAEKLLFDLVRPFERSSGTSVRVGCCVGIGRFKNDDAVRAPQVVARAEKALARAKRSGRGEFRVFDPAIDGDDAAE